METIILTGRSSKLSLIQIELVKARIESCCPDVEVKIQTSNSLGDRLQNIPLQTMEGTDFFTEEIFENLYSGEADIAIHSLKDMSASHFFGENLFAVVDRDEERDVAIFNPDVIEKLKLGVPIGIGTCSPRRELMTTEFLREALPQLNSNIQIETKFIRGNVDTRLQKLDAGEYDGIILAAAGLNRLLSKTEHAPSISSVLKNKKIMVLPIFECTPAPCQGAIVAEALTQNKKAVNVLQKINNPNLFDECVAEKKIGLKYGAGCYQKFGVATIPYGNQHTVYAAGENENDIAFKEWFNLPELYIDPENIWDGSDLSESKTTTHMNVELKLDKPVVFISNFKAVQDTFIPKLGNKKVWAAGVKTWRRLATRGIWVEGCSDGLGLESTLKIWKSPFIDIHQNQVTILTNTRSAENWKSKNWDAIGTYSIHGESLSHLELQHADLVFWSSSFQYHRLKNQVKSTALHACASGETSQQLIHDGLNPILFPTIQSFQQWKTKAILSPIAG
jgi:hydroxymethylbilane synthase